MVKFFPFNLTGSQFLLFYIAFGLTLLVLVRIGYWLRERSWSGALPALNDAYAIAYLRGGPNEAVRVAILSLVDRGLLVDDGQRLRVQGEPEGFVRRPVEQSLLRFFGQGRALDVDDAAKDPRVRNALDAMRGELIELTLMHEPWDFSGNARAPVMLAGLILLVATAATRMLWSGPPFVFLFMLAAVLVLILLRIYAKRITALGRQKLGQLQVLFKRLKDRAGELRGGGQTNELALLAAVFGMSAVPTRLQAVADRLKPKRDGGSGCGSGGCGSSSSDGGGCGGGGCGGGCG